ncbi:MAG: GAF domain-containing protein [Deltaproteobacteria bacterium]|nr:GAF domain-containing protein [Deltaproteobacteria bacterium]
MTLTLEALRPCLDGFTPSVLSTCAPDGAPNVTFLSQATFVDAHHVALSFQFFSKTRQNVLANPRAQLLVWHPVTAEMFRVDITYVRTETEGPIFERMRAMLSGIASHTGMADVFRLLGADIYRVHRIRAVPARALAPGRTPPSRLGGLRAAVEALRDATDLDSLFQHTLGALATHLEVSHAMVLAHDVSRGRLYTVASIGYASNGAGAEIALGDGVVGVAGRERVPIRLTHGTRDRAYANAIREETTKHGGHSPSREVPWPGLPLPGSQVAAPILAGEQLLGVLFAESPSDGRFGFDDEDALAVLAAHLGASMIAVGQSEGEPARVGEPTTTGAGLPAPIASGKRVVLRHFREDDSVFLDEAYLIKGVAGALLWAMASDYVKEGRVTFTNRELRLDPRIRLPEIGDNLEARLVLLRKRLVDREASLRLERVGRGHLRLDVACALELVEVG